MTFYLPIISLLITSLMFSSLGSKTLWKRSVQQDQPVLLPNGGSKLVCDGGRAIIECNPGTSIYIVLAVYGRIELNHICVKGTEVKEQKICTSTKTFDKISSHCIGEKDCTVEVNEDNLGTPLTLTGDSCSNTHKYLKLEYRCVPDCNPPRLESGVAFIGNQFSISSKVTLQCQDGLEPFSNGSRLDQITCQLDGSWSGASIICKDIDECADKVTNKCDRRADCANIMGSYTCICVEGYFGDGFTCDAGDVDKTWIESTKNETYNITTDSNCGGKIYKNNGIFNSPNYPNLYPNSANCEWVITAMPSKVIEIEFLNFNLEESTRGKGCSRDYLSIYDGPYRSPSYWLFTSCGSEIPEKVRSVSNQVRIEFKTDQEASFSGFRASFKSFNPLAICENFMSNKYPGVEIIEGNMNETARAGDIVVLGCMAGYNVTSGSVLTRVCQNDNTWDDLSDPCAAVQCKEPIEFPNKGLLLNGTSKDYFYNGKPLMYQCKMGYFLASAPGVQKTIFCNQLGLWSNDGDTDFPQCLPVVCEITPNLSPPQHAVWVMFDEDGNQITPTVGRSVAYESFIKYSCAKGYVMVGEAKRSCSAYQDNKWTGRAIVCEEESVIPGLTNTQIANIIAPVVGVVVLVAAVALLYCCMKEKKKKKRTREIKEYRHRQMTAGKYHGNTWNSKPYVSKTNGREHHTSRRKISTNTSKSYNKPSALDLQLQQQKKYAQSRPYMLPTVVKSTPPSWSAAQGGATVAPKSGLSQNRHTRPNFQGQKTSQKKHIKNDSVFHKR